MKSRRGEGRLAQVTIVEFGRRGAALAEYLGVAPSAVNRQATGRDLYCLG